MVTPTPNAIDSPAEPVVCTMLFSRIVARRKPNDLREDAEQRDRQHRDGNRGRHRHADLEQQIERRGAEDDAEDRADQDGRPGELGRCWPHREYRAYVRALRRWWTRRCGQAGRSVTMVGEGGSGGGFGDISGIGHRSGSRKANACLRTRLRVDSRFTQPFSSPLTRVCRKSVARVERHKVASRTSAWDGASAILCAEKKENED